MGLRTQFTRGFVSIARNSRKMRNAMLELVLGDQVQYFRDFGDHRFVFFGYDLIGLSLLDYGEYTRQSVSDLRKKLQEHGRDTAGISILEVGANIGTHTVYFFLDLDCADVTCLEPDPENFRTLGTNIVLNDLTAKTTLLPVGASDAIGSAEFTRVLTNRGASHVGAPKQDEPQANTLRVDLTTIDTLVDSGALKGKDIGLIWMDVEGHELSALKGMRELIRIQHPPIFLEYTPSSDPEHRKEMRELLFGAYDHVYTYEGGFEPLDRDRFMAIDKLVDVLVI